MLRLANLTQALAPELGAYRELVTYARNVARLLGGLTGAAASEPRVHQELAKHNREITRWLGDVTGQVEVTPERDSDLDAQGQAPADRVADDDVTAAQQWFDAIRAEQPASEAQMLLNETPDAVGRRVHLASQLVADADPIVQLRGGCRFGCRDRRSDLGRSWVCSPGSDDICIRPVSCRCLVAGIRRSPSHPQSCPADCSSPCRGADRFRRRLDRHAALQY